VGDEAPELDILYRDGQLLAVNKPSGLLVHRGWGRADLVLVDQVRALLETDVVHPIHRLDRPTSGVVLFALDPEAAKRVQWQFQQGYARKSYLALVRGQPDDEVEIDHPIPRRPDGPRVEAVTHVRRLHTCEILPRTVSLVHARPRTGRFHQIRRHLKHIDHPVIGDSNYGKGKINRAMGSRFGLTRLALHALSLGVRHPVSKEDLVFDASLPDDLIEPFGRIGIPAEAWEGIEVTRAG